MQMISIDPDELRGLASALGAASQDLAGVSSSAGAISIDASAPVGAALDQLSSAASTLTATESRLFDLANEVLRRAAAFGGDAPASSFLGSTLGCCCGAAGAGTAMALGAAAGAGPAGPLAGGAGVVSDATFGSPAAAPFLAAGGGAGVVAAGNGFSGLTSDWLGGMDDNAGAGSAPIGAASGWLSGMDTSTGSSGPFGSSSGWMSQMAQANANASTPLNWPMPTGGAHLAGTGIVSAANTRGMMNLQTGMEAMSLNTLSPNGASAVTGDFAGWAHPIGVAEALGGGGVLSVGYIPSSLS